MGSLTIGCGIGSVNDSVRYGFANKAHEFANNRGVNLVIIASLGGNKGTDSQATEW